VSQSETKGILNHKPHLRNLKRWLAYELFYSEDTRATLAVMKVRLWQ